MTKIMNDLKSDNKTLMKGDWEKRYQIKLEDPETQIWQADREQRIHDRRSAILTRKQRAVEEADKNKEAEIAQKKPVSIFAA